MSLSYPNFTYNAANFFFFPRYEDGRRSTRQFMSACIPKQYKPNKVFNSYDETLEYEPNGPYFFIKTKGWFLIISYSAAILS